MKKPRSAGLFIDREIIFKVYPISNIAKVAQRKDRSHNKIRQKQKENQIMSSEDFLAENSVSTRNDCVACRVINKVSLSMDIFCYVIATLACIPLLILMIVGLLDGSGFSQNQFNLLVLILIFTKSYSAEIWINRLIAGNKHNQNEKNAKTDQVD